MQKLEIRVDYNVILTHFVDTLSTWDQFVDSHVYDYYEKQFGLTSLDREMITTYVKTRKRLKWGSETELFAWAHAEFSNNPRFDKLLPVIRYFEGRKTLDGVSLKVILQEKTDKMIANNYSQIEKRFLAKWRRVIYKYMKLFMSTNSQEMLPCYITYSPDNIHTMAGANGQGMYIEMRDSDIMKKKMLEADILHELLHKQVSPSTYFEKHVQFFKAHKNLTANAMNYPDSFLDYIEEVIVYAICEIVEPTENSIEKKLRTHEKKGNLEMLAVWHGVSAVTKYLADFYTNESGLEKVRGQLEDYFVGKAKL